MYKHLGKQSVQFENNVYITHSSSTVGPKEGEGPLSHYFDKISEDILFGMKTWEQAESKMVQENIQSLVDKSNISFDDIDYILAGDLLNQSISSTFGIRSFNRPYLGLFGACSTMGLALSLGSILIDGGFGKKIIASASSHFCSAEKTFRTPLDLGTQRPLTASWTVTGDGAVLLSNDGSGPCVKGITTGKIVDMGIVDANNMGAAMAPAAADTIRQHFIDFNREPSYYDIIATGDLGHYGHKIVEELLKKDNYDMTKNYTDCGIEIFSKGVQDTHAGGSGCGCCASTFAGYFFKQLQQGIIKKMLFVPTGALLSSTSALQGESIPSIAHAVVIESNITLP